MQQNGRNILKDSAKDKGRHENYFSRNIKGISFVLPDLELHTMVGGMCRLPTGRQVAACRGAACFLEAV
jgi:hypothetical protein